MQYRNAVPVLALLALAACSGEKVTSNIRAAPGPVMVVEHTVLQWTDAAGAKHTAQLPDRLVREIVVPRGSGGPGSRQRRPPVEMATVVQQQMTDAAGNAWNVAVTVNGQGLQTNTAATANDTATYSQALTWTALGDTAYALTQVTQTVSSPTINNTATQTYSSSSGVVPVNGTARAWLPLWWLARGGTTALSAAALLALPDAAEAQWYNPTWIVTCAADLLYLFGADLAYASATAALMMSWNPVTISAYWGAASVLAGTELSLAHCINGGGGGGSTGSTKPKAT